ncbi:arf/Sar family, other [Fonticula alba]|uniref:Arf/Sar family, other n=1 Tax=Fonticula alba TaxID=691883 RepID=A0A058Z0C2_FONAL|nr:arf/Sar family, other [Fonticula alba]KCV67571.1 arf/Sar family, other [Fonticula alba]|eukprot:XP_009498012.1 arf/Sar family, other [Fonticula alba]
MGFVFSKLVWYFLGVPEEVKLVIVGLDNAGKTTFLYRLLLGQVVATTPTIGSNVEEFNYKNIKFLMWDIGGQDNLRSSWSTYYINSKAVIMVVDSTDVARFPIVRRELHRMLSHEHLARIPLLVLANKQDLDEALTTAEISDALGLPELDVTTPWHIAPCSAISGEGTTEGLDWVVSQLKNEPLAEVPGAASAPASTPAPALK